MLFCRWFHHRPPTQSVCVGDVILGTDRLLCPGGRGFSEKCGVYPPQMKIVPPLAITIFKCPPPPPPPPLQSLLDQVRFSLILGH